MKKKKCQTCGFVKPLYQFHARKEAQDFHASHCRSCAKIRRDASKAKFRKIGEAHREKHGFVPEVGMSGITSY